MTDYVVNSNGIDFFVRTFSSGVICATITPVVGDGDSVIVIKTTDTETKEVEFTIRLPKNVNHKDMDIWAAAVHVASTVMAISEEEDDGESTQEHRDSV